MSSSPRPKDPGLPARGLALTITNLTKLGGVIVAFNELILRPDFRPAAAALAAFMMAGAQVSENVLIAVINHFFAVPGGEKEEDR
jgi:hypothetical protein